MKPRKAPAKPAPKAASEIVYGLYAGLALLRKRPGDALRVAYSPDVAREVEPALRTLGSRISATRMGERELERFAGTKQHEGLAVEARPRRFTSPAELADLLVRERGTALALDRVRNPHNIGAIVRSAAFFGVSALVLGAPAPHPALDPYAVRIAEGGAEHLALCRTTDLADTLSRLRARGIKVFGADSHADASVLGFRFPRPAVLVLGHEREGLGPRVRAQCDGVLSIPGSGALDSLNVAVAAGVLISELVRSAQ